MVFITATRYEVDAAVAYHGGDTEKYLSEVGGLAAPLLIHLPEEDEFMSKATQAEIKAALAEIPSSTFTAIRASVTLSLCITVHIITPPPSPLSPMVGRTNSMAKSPWSAHRKRLARVSVCPALRRQDALGFDYRRHRRNQDMLDFCGQHNITADVEVISIQQSTRPTSGCSSRT